MKKEKLKEFIKNSIKEMSTDEFEKAAMEATLESMAKESNEYSITSKKTSITKA